MPSEEVHAFVNDLERRIGTHLLGRRMYDMLVASETMETQGEPAEIADYKAIWLDTDKVVYSRSLEQPQPARIFPRPASALSSSAGGAASAGSGPRRAARG